MFSKFDEEAKKVLLNMQKEMVSLKHPYIGSEHLLLSLLKYGDDDFVKKFKSVNVTYDTFREELIRVVGVGKSSNEFYLYTPLLRNILEAAGMDSADKGKKCVDTSDLFLALFEEGEGVAIRILLGMDVDVDNLYDDFYVGKKSKNVKLIVENFGVNLNEKSKKGEIDPVIGRDKEISRLIEILSRRTKNNPLLLGEAGVGKTAVVEELARRIEKSKVPFKLLNKKIISVSMASLVAGTKYRGEFEEKLTKIIKELENNPEIILFIDEIHSMVNAGGAEGAINASDILKPYLARGKIKVIGATTTLEYNKYILKDKALNRRFELIKVLEPSLDETEDILKKIKGSFEKHYNIKISNKNIKDIIKYTNKYILDRKNPDKSIDILDSVCAMKEVSEISKTKLEELESEKLAIITQKEAMVRKNDFKKALELHNKEKELEISIKKEYAKNIRITEKDIMTLISRKCNIPIIINAKQKYRELKKYLNTELIGQNDAIDKVIINLLNHDAEKPLSLLFTGSTGVGKTEMVKKISKFLNMNLLRIDMSEYKEDISISRLIGSSAGYVGYDDGAIFDKIKMEPFTCILLDELEKGSPSVINLFLQILDEGYITNSKGEKIDFKNTLIFATSNVKGVKKIGFMNSKSNYNNNFSKEFIARFSDIIEFNDITEDMIKMFLNKKHIKDQNILNEFDFHKNGFRGLDQFLEKEIKKHKNSKMQV